MLCFFQQKKSINQRWPVAVAEWCHVALAIDYYYSFLALCELFQFDHSNAAINLTIRLKQIIKICSIHNINKIDCCCCCCWRSLNSISFYSLNFSSFSFSFQDLELCQIQFLFLCQHLPLADLFFNRKKCVCGPWNKNKRKIATISLILLFYVIHVNLCIGNTT